MAGYKQRVFHGTDQRWKGGFAKGNSISPNNMYGGETYFATGYEPVRDIYMNYSEQLNNTPGRGTVYATDIDPDDFYRAYQPLEKQSPKVQNALKDIMKSNPKMFDSFGEIIDYPSAGDVKGWNKLMDSLYKYGIKGINIPSLDSSRESWVFRYAKDVPVVIDTNRGTDLIPELNKPTNKVVREAQPKYTSTNVKKDYDAAIKAFNTAKNNVVKMLENPYIKPLVKTGSTVLEAVDRIGIPMMAADFLWQTSQFNPENIQRNRVNRINNKRTLPTRGVGYNNF